MGFTLTARSVLAVAISLIAVYGGCRTASAGPDKFQNLSGSDVLPALLKLKASTEAGLPGPFVVEPGQVRIFDTGLVLATEELVLSPGSTLVLSGSSSGDISRERYIIARKVTIRPGSPAPVITWNRPDAPAAVPPPVGKAPSGSAGQYEGANGGNGADGAAGNQGFPGISAPVIYVALDGMDAGGAGQLAIDLRGQDGGPGGDGQSGGDGGPGARGNPGSPALFDCKRGGGNGGRGGNGGSGGPGGLGGRGGDGGTLVLLADPDVIENVRSHFHVVYLPGTPGLGGHGGIGGDRGPPGPGGPGNGLCGGGNTGAAGDPGPRGQDNSANRGPSGQPGAWVPIPLNQSNLIGIGLRVRQ